MKSMWLVAVFAAFFNFIRAADDTGRDLYSSRYDNLNVDSILGSKRLVTNYAECLLNRKPCPPEGKDLKRILPEALRTKCSRCSTTQKENALKIISTLYEQYPEQYNNLADKWDPTGEYNRRFEEYLANQAFNQIGNEDSPPSSSASTIDIQQKPTTKPSSSNNVAPVAPSLANRFGFDDSDTNSVNVLTRRTTKQTKPPPTTSHAPAVAPTTQRSPTIPTIRPFGNLPIISYLSNIGNKLSTSAQQFAGMVRNTVRVIIGVDPITGLHRQQL